MNLKHVKNFKQGDDSARMMIYSEITSDDGNWFAQEMKYLGENGVKNIDIHINSSGGSVMGALSMVAAIRNFDGHVCTINDGIAASSAGFIFATGHTRKMVDFARVMLHDPSHSGGDLDQKTLNALKEIKDIIVAIFDSNTSMTTDQIENIMTLETWLNAEQALEMNMIDEIIVSNREAKNTFERLIELPDLSLNTIMNVAENINKKLNINSKPKFQEMENLKNHLSLDKSANETAVLKAVKNIESDVEKYKNENKTLTDDLEAEKAARLEVENKLKVIETKSIEAVVDNAIEKNIFDKEKRDEMIKTAEKIGLENFNNLIGSMKSKPASIKDQLDLNGDGSEGNKDLPKEFQNKSFREIEKSKGGEAFLTELKNSNKELYEKMSVAEYGEIV